MTIFTSSAPWHVAAGTGGRHGRHAHDIVDTNTCVCASRYRSASRKPVALLTAGRDAAMREFGSTKVGSPCIPRGRNKRTRNAIGVTDLTTDVVGHRNVRCSERTSRHNLRQTIKGACCYIDAVAITATGGNATVAERSVGKVSPTSCVCSYVACFATQSAHGNVARRRRLYGVSLRGG